MQAARRRKETALADLREIQAATLRGDRLRREDVERARIESYRQVRAGVLAATSRIRSRLPNLTARDAVVIDEELRAALIALAEVER